LYFIKIGVGFHKNVKAQYIILTLAIA